MYDKCPIIRSHRSLPSHAHLYDTIKLKSIQSKILNSSTELQIVEAKFSILPKCRDSLPTDDDFNSDGDDATEMQS